MHDLLIVGSSGEHGDTRTAWASAEDGRGAFAGDFLPRVKAAAAAGTVVEIALGVTVRAGADGDLRYEIGAAMANVAGSPQRHEAMARAMAGAVSQARRILALHHAELPDMP